MPVVAQKTAVVAQKAKPPKPEPVKTPKATGEERQVKPAKTPPRETTPEAKATGKLRPTGAAKETLVQVDGTIDYYERGQLVKHVPPKPAAATTPAAKTPPPLPTRKAAPAPQRPRLSATDKVDWRLDEKWPWEPGKPMPKDKKGKVLLTVASSA
jgi:hypothetical protein